VGICGRRYRAFFGAAGRSSASRTLGTNKNFVTRDQGKPGRRRSCSRDSDPRGEVSGVTFPSVAGDPRRLTRCTSWRTAAATSVSSRTDNAMKRVIQAGAKAGQSLHGHARVPARWAEKDKSAPQGYREDDYGADGVVSIRAGPWCTMHRRRCFKAYVIPSASKKKTAGGLGRIRP